MFTSGSFIFSKEFSMLRYKFLNAFTIVLILLQAVLPIPAMAMANAAGTALSDYAPGNTVTFSGSSTDGYAAAEAVHVDVSGPNSFTAACDATADDSGAWSCQVT